MATLCLRTRASEVPRLLSLISRIPGLQRKAANLCIRYVSRTSWIPFRFAGTGSQSGSSNASDEAKAIGTETEAASAGEAEEPHRRRRKKRDLFQSSSIHVNEVTKEIHLYRDENNGFAETTYVDIDAAYGPPLAILLPWVSPEESVLRRLIDVYGTRGFDVVTVNLSKEQLLYPRREGGGIRVVANFLDYLNGCHRYRPYIVHGLSTGVYVYGEMMAQVTEQMETYHTIVGNIKGCLWDSPVEFSVVAPIAGKTLYPRNIVKRWFFERALTQHFADHRRDSIECWERARENFCRQKCKVPNLFFVSERDPLSCPATMEPIRNQMEQNGIPTYQKTWQDTKHLEHFTKHFDEYMHGINLFFSLASLFPDPSGRFQSYSTNDHLTSIRLSKKAREARSIP